MYILLIETIFPFSQVFKMEKDECNLLAAKALRSLMRGDKKAASRYQKELEDLRKGKSKSILRICGEM